MLARAKAFLRNRGPAPADCRARTRPHGRSSSSGTKLSDTSFAGVEHLLFPSLSLTVLQPGKSTRSVFMTCGCAGTYCARAIAAVIAVRMRIRFSTAFDSNPSGTIATQDEIRGVEPTVHDIVPSDGVLFFPRVIVGFLFFFHFLTPATPSGVPSDFIDRLSEGFLRLIPNLGCLFVPVLAGSNGISCYYSHPSGS